MYELLAIWSSDDIKGDLFGVDDDIKLKEIDKYTEHSRLLGISIGCYNEQINRFKYPLKLVSCSFKGTYEDLDTPSYGDQNQGAGELYR